MSEVRVYERRRALHLGKMLKGRRAGPLIQIDAQIAFCLALHASVVDHRNPGSRSTVIRKLSVSYGRMGEIVDVEEKDFFAGILNYR